MGTIQSSQCPEPLNPIFAVEREFFEWFWLKVIEYHQKAGSKDLSFVPEYGSVYEATAAAVDMLISCSPFPYHPFNSSKPYGDVADEEGIRLHSLFNATIAKK